MTALVAAMLTLGKAAASDTSWEANLLSGAASQECGGRRPDRASPRSEPIQPWASHSRAWRWASATSSEAISSESSLR